VYVEAAEFGSQQYLGGRSSRRSVVPTGQQLVSFMRTKNFVFPVPTDLHLNYNYADSLNKLTILTTRYSNRVVKVSVTSNGENYSWELTTLYSSGAHYLLFLISAIVVGRRKFTKFNSYFVFAPLFAFVIVFILMNSEQSVR
jgi:hypothetical protein